jgi:hypothetical protein
MVSMSASWHENEAKRMQPAAISGKADRKAVVRMEATFVAADAYCIDAHPDNET